MRIGIGIGEFTVGIAEMTGVPATVDNPIA